MCWGGAAEPGLASTAGAVTQGDGVQLTTPGATGCPVLFSHHPFTLHITAVPAVPGSSSPGACGIFHSRCPRRRRKRKALLFSSFFMFRFPGREMAHSLLVTAIKHTLKSSLIAAGRGHGGGHGWPSSRPRALGMLLLAARDGLLRCFLCCRLLLLFPAPCWECRGIPRPGQQQQQ